MIDIQREFDRITGGRWIADPDDVDAILDYLYETESILTHSEPQSASDAEALFDER
jgi:hypothetical protein